MKLGGEKYRTEFNACVTRLMVALTTELITTPIMAGVSVFHRQNAGQK